MLVAEQIHVIVDCGFSFAPLLFVNFFCSETNYDVARSADPEIGVPGAIGAGLRKAAWLRVYTDTPGFGAWLC